MNILTKFIGLTKLTILYKYQYLSTIS